MGKIFICYSHKDKAVKNDLINHLSLYKPELETWHDGQLKVGDNWKVQIIQAIEDSSAAILLVSINFLNSRFISEQEIPRILKKKLDDGIGVFSLILRPCDWNYNKNLSDLLVRPFDGKPLSSFKGSNREQILVDFAKEVKEIMSSAGSDSDKGPNSKSKSVSKSVDFSSMEIDTSKPILDQIHDYISFRFKEVNIIPKHLFIRNYPFRKEESFSPHYAVFTLYTDNEELFELFESLKVGKDGKITFKNNKFSKGVKDYENKIKTVLKKLSRNHILFIKSKNSQKGINIVYNVETQCDCVRCRFFRFQFEASFKAFSIETNSIEERFRLAYVHCQVGNFLKAVKIFKKLVIESKKENLNTWCFIANYNLSKLAIFIRNHYWGENSQDEVLEELTNIDLEEIYRKTATIDNEKLLDWIKNNSFYTESRGEIHETVSKIRDHYYTQLKGGWSYNSHLRKLLNEYADIEAFLSNNYIIYDRFREFKELTEVFIEGLFISHAIENTQNSRLANFDDWLVLIILQHGRAERIMSFFDRYNLKEIEYKPTSKTGRTFIELMSNFLKGNDKTKIGFEEYCEENNRYFWDRYNTFFSNLMVMAGIINLDNKQVNKVAEWMLDFLKTEKSIYPANIKYIRFFINRKGKQIKKSTLKRLLLHSIENGKLHGDGTIEAICGQIEKHHGGIIISKKNLSDFLDIAFKKCPKCNREHSPEFVVFIHEAIKGEGMKDKIRKEIIESLNSKFRIELYYFAAIYGVLGNVEEYFRKFIEAAKPQPKRTSFKSIFTGKEDNRFPLVNMLLNMCFKYQIDMNKPEFNDFKDIDPYYKWLFDMNGFNYDYFNPLWVREYATQYYLEQIRKYPIIKEKLCEYLATNSNPQLERTYIKLYCRE